MLLSRCSRASWCVIALAALSASCLGRRRDKQHDPRRSDSGPESGHPAISARHPANDELHREAPGSPAVGDPGSVDEVQSSRGKGGEHVGASAVPDRVPTIFVEAVDALLTRPDDSTTLRKAMSDLGSAPLYQQISICDRVMQYLTTEKTVATRGYVYRTGEHDLNRVAGRAALALAILCSLELDRVTPATSNEELEAIHKDASRALIACRASVVQIAQAYDVGADTDLLRARYHGRLTPGISAAHAVESGQLMGSLLKEWFPIDKRVADLVAIVGVEPKYKGRTCRYSFNTGRSGVEYLFVVKEGLICSVEIYGME